MSPESMEECFSCMSPIIVMPARALPSWSCSWGARGGRARARVGRARGPPVVCGVMCLHPESKQQTTPAAPRDALECVAALARTRKTASALRIADLRSTDSTCSSSSATWNDVRFELKHRARMGAT